MGEVEGGGVGVRELECVLDSFLVYGVGYHGDLEVGLRRQSQMWIRGR